MEIILNYYKCGNKDWIILVFKDGGFIVNFCLFILCILNKNYFF